MPEQSVIVALPVTMTDEALRDDFVHGVGLWNWSWWHRVEMLPEARGIVVHAESADDEGEVVSVNVTWDRMRRVFRDLVAHPGAYGVAAESEVMDHFLSGVRGADEDGAYDFGALDAKSGDTWMQACVYGRVEFS